MFKNKLLRVTTILSIIGLLTIVIMAKPASALISQNSVSYFWANDTNINAVAAGDVNGDGQTEIVTAGWFNDGLRWNAQLQVWNATTLAVESYSNWYWINDTQVSSIAIGDVNGDGKQEIVTGGTFFDGSIWNAQLTVWNGSTLAVLNAVTWAWGNDTQVSSVAVGNFTGSKGLDIVTGGAFYNGSIWIAQLTTWNGTSLAVEKVVAWAMGFNTYVNSVTVGSVTAGSNAPEIVTGGAFSDGVRNNAQLLLWNGTTLAVEKFVSWFWTGDTEVNSVSIANLTGGNTASIITGGSFYDGLRFNSQLMIWNNVLSVQRLISWYTTSNTKIASIAVGNYTGGNSLDIITAGTFIDGTRNNGQLIDFNSTSLVVNSATQWFMFSDTTANSAVIGGTSFGNRVFTGGSFFDLTRSNAQLIIWT